MSDNEQKAKGKEIDLLEILYTLWSHKWIIAVLMILCAVFMFVKTVYFTADTYTSNGVLYVSNKSEKIGETPNYYGSISQGDINTSRALSATYMELLQTRSFLETVAASQNGKYTWKDIYNMTLVASINETELLLISVTALDPDDAYSIANAFVKNAPQKLLSVYKSGEVSVADVPRVPTSPNGKGLGKQIALGALVGFILGAAFILIRSFFDNTVHNTEEIAKRYNITILGEITQL